MTEYRKHQNSLRSAPLLSAPIPIRYKLRDKCDQKGPTKDLTACPDLACPPPEKFTVWHNMAFPVATHCTLHHAYDEEQKVYIACAQDLNRRFRSFYRKSVRRLRNQVSKVHGLNSEDVRLINSYLQSIPSSFRPFILPHIRLQNLRRRRSTSTSMQKFIKNVLPIYHRLLIKQYMRYLDVFIHTVAPLKLQLELNGTEITLDGNYYREWYDPVTIKDDLTFPLDLLEGPRLFGFNNTDDQGYLSDASDTSLQEEIAGFPIWRSQSAPPVSGPSSSRFALTPSPTLAASYAHKRKSPPKPSKIDLAHERLINKMLTQVRAQARDRKSSHANNDDARVWHSQMDSDDSSSSTSTVRPQPDSSPSPSSSSAPPPAPTAPTQMPAYDADDIPEAVRAHISAADLAALTEILPPPEEAPAEESGLWSYVISFFQMLSSGYEHAKDGMTWLAEKTGDIVTFCQGFCSTVKNFFTNARSGFSTANSLLGIVKTAKDFLSDGKVQLLLKIFGLLMIYLVGHMFGIGAISRILATIYCFTVFPKDDVYAWIPVIVETSLAVSSMWGSESFSIAPSLLTISALLAAAIFGNVDFLKSPLSRDGFLARADIASRGANAITNIAEKVGFVFKKCVGLFGLEKYGFSPDYASSVPADMQEIFDDVLFFSNHEVMKTLSTSAVNCQRAIDMKKKYITVSKAYAQIPELRARLHSVAPYIMRVSLEAERKNPMHQKARTEPVSVFLYGLPAVGKSLVTHLICSTVMMAKGIIPPDADADTISKILSEQIYVRNDNEDHWNGYHNQFAVCNDDVLQQKDSETNPSNHPIEFIKASNLFSYPLDMADLSDKGNTFYTSPLYVASTNAKVISVPSIASRQAYLRRITIALHVTINPAYADSTGALLPEHAQKATLVTDAFRFHFHDFETGLPVELDERNKPVTFDLNTLIEIILKSLEKKKDSAQKVMQGCLSFGRDFFQAKPQWRSEGGMPYTPVRPTDFSLVSDPGLFFAAQRLSHNSVDFYSLAADAHRDLVFSDPISVVCWAHTRLRAEKHAGTTISDEEARAVVARIDNEAFSGTDNDPTGIASVYSSLKEFKLWLTTQAAKFASWITSGWMPKLVSSIAILAGLYSVAHFGYDRYKRLTVAASSNDTESSFDDLVKDTNVHRANENEGFPVTGGEARIPYRVKQPTLFHTVKEWCNPTGVSAHTSDEDAKRYALACDLFTSTQFPHLPSDDFFPSYGNVRFIRPEALKKATSLDDEDIETYTNIIRPWFYEDFFSMSGRKKTTRPSPRSKLPQPTLRPRPNMTSEFRNSNTAEVWNRVSTNLHVLKAGDRFVNILFTHGNNFVTNRHSYRELSAIVDKVPGALAHISPTGTKGTSIPWTEIKWSVPNLDHHSDVIFGVVPTRYFNMFPDIRKHFVLREDLNFIKFKNCTLTTPAPNRCITRDGVVLNVFDTLVNNSIQAFHVTGFVTSIRTSPGDCGGYYLLDGADTRRVFGIHCAGNGSEGMVSVLYQEMFDEVTAPPTKSMNSESGSLPTGNVRVLGTCVAPFMPTKTKFRKSEVHGSISESHVAPALLARPDLPGGPFEKAIAKQFDEVHPVCEETLAAATDEYFSVLSRPAPPTQLRVFTFDEATRGIEGDPFVRPINRSRSSGYPYCMQTKLKGKTQWFGNDEWIRNEHTEALIKIIDGQIADMQTGSIQEYIFMDVLKDETRPIEKVRAGKTRVISAAPMDFIIVFRMYYLDFLCYMMEHRIHNESAVGIKAQSPEWTTLYRHLTKYGPRVVAGDFSNYDGSLNPRILWSVYDIIEQFYKLYTRSDNYENDRMVRYCLWHNIVNSYHLAGEILYQVNHSQPSGNPGTAIINSMYNSIACRYTFYRIYDYSIPFSQVVSMIAYGDDNVLNIHPSFVEFNQLSMAVKFAEFGMTYTDESKQGDLRDRTIGEVAFLKRTFNYSAKDDFCFSPLALDSILECFNWVSRADNEIDTMQQNATTAYVELSMHPQSVFDEWAPKIQSALARTYNIQVNYLRADRYRDSIMSGVALVRYPHMDWS